MNPSGEPGTRSQPDHGGLHTRRTSPDQEQPRVAGKARRPESLDQQMDPLALIQDANTACHHSIDRNAQPHACGPSIKRCGNIDGIRHQTPLGTRWRLNAQPIHEHRVKMMTDSQWHPFHEMQGSLVFQAHHRRRRVDDAAAESQGFDGQSWPEDPDTTLDGHPKHLQQSIASGQHNPTPVPLLDETH
jgi:hypothetical protein